MTFDAASLRCWVPTYHDSALSQALRTSNGSNWSPMEPSPSCQAFGRPYSEPYYPGKCQSASKILHIAQRRGNVATIKLLSTHNAYILISAAFPKLV